MGTEWIMPSSTQLAALVALLLVSANATRQLIRDRIERKGCPLPPGPPRLPLLGSVLSMDTEESFKNWTRLRAKYGDIVYIRLLDLDVVVLNSRSDVTELFEKRSLIYSDRPFTVTIESHGHDSNFSFTPYGEQWRLCRRIFHQTFRADAAASYRPIQLREARRMILHVMENPSNYESHYTTFGATISMRSIYDYNPTPRNDQMISAVDEFLRTSVSALLPQKAIFFKLFPFLLHVPDWLPGSRFKHEARMARELSIRMVEVPYQYVQKRMETNEDAHPSMVSDHITRMEKLDDPYRSAYEAALKIASSSAFVGSVETTSSTLMTFTLAMVQNPRIWKCAQAEIDTIVGTDRLPEFDDRPSLPYVDAILRETLRWQPPVPLVGHAPTTSDIYNGFYIPKGATVFANGWAMSRDETRYPNPEEFIPERFLDVDGMLTDDIPDFAFGFGRRICPGRYIADASLWGAMVTMLATLDFNPAKDANGKDIAIKAVYKTKLVRHPLAFPCHLVPRPHISKASLERALAI